MSEFSINITTENKITRDTIEAILNSAMSEKNIACKINVHQESIFCENHKEAFVGDKVRVVGKPETFFYDANIIDIEGVITKIDWDEDGHYFRIENYKFVTSPECKITLLE